MDQQGLQQGLAVYNKDNPNNPLTLSDVGAAWGLSPEQSAEWMQGGLASIQPTTSPPAPGSAQQRQQVTDYLTSKGFSLDPQGLEKALWVYNKDNPNNPLTLSDVGAAWGLSPEQSAEWMYRGENAPATGIVKTSQWYNNEYLPAKTQSGGLSSIQQPAIKTAPTQVQAAPTQVQAAPTQVQAAPTQVQAAPTEVQAAPAPAPGSAQQRQQVTDYLTSKGFSLDQQGLQQGLAVYNKDNPNNPLTLSDVGAAWGLSPEQSAEWMQGQKFAEGGAVGGYNCGGLSQAFDREEEFENERYVDGDGGGQDDDVEARVSSGEYVFDADVVSALGDGNNEAGARILDELRAKIRQHKRAAPANKIPPKAKSIEQYLKEVR